MYEIIIVAVYFFLLNLCTLYTRPISPVQEKPFKLAKRIMSKNNSTKVTDLAGNKKATNFNP